MVDETSNTWLNSLKDGNSRADGWRELVGSYGPFIRGILVSHGMAREAAEDVAQNVMTVVVRRLPEFERQRTGSFRSWLRTITTNCIRDYKKSERNAVHPDGDFEHLIKAIDDPRSELTRIWNQQHAHHTVGVLLDSIAGDFNAKTVEAFRQLAIHEQPVAEVSERLELSPNACLIARSRVLKRLRERLRELYGEDEGFFDLLP